MKKILLSAVFLFFFTLAPSVFAAECGSANGANPTFITVNSTTTCSSPSDSVEGYYYYFYLNSGQEVHFTVTTEPVNWKVSFALAKKDEWSSKLLLAPNTNIKTGLWGDDGWVIDAGYWEILVIPNPTKQSDDTSGSFQGINSFSLSITTPQNAPVEPPALKSNGIQCSSNSQCSSGNCNYVCCEAGKTCCEYNSDCPSGQTCNTSSHYCTVSSGAKQYCQACSNDNECSSAYCGDFGAGGKKCANPNVSTNCCPDGTYIPNFQHGVDCCDICTDAEGGIYTMDCINHKCVDEEDKKEETGGKLGNGKSCTSGSECATGNCNYVCCQAGKKCCNMDLDCVLGKNSMPDAVCDRKNNYCVSKAEKYTETTPFSLSVNGLNAVECENDVSLGIIKIKDKKAAAWIKDGSRVMLFTPGETVKYSVYEGEVSVKVHATQMTENIAVLDEIIHKWKYPSTKEGQTTDVKCQKYMEEYGGDAQKQADEIIAKGPEEEAEGKEALTYFVETVNRDLQCDDIVMKFVGRAKEGGVVVQFGDDSIRFTQGSEYEHKIYDFYYTIIAKSVDDTEGNEKLGLQVYLGDLPIKCLLGSGEFNKRPLEGKCFTDKECESGLCSSWNSCIEKTGKCSSDNDCSINTYCINGECQDKPECNGTIYSPNSSTCCAGSLVKKGKNCSSKKLSSNPMDILGFNLTGMSDEVAAAYDKDNSLSSYFGLGFIGYTEIAKSWGEVANYELRKGKMNLTNAKNMGLFDMLNWGIKGLYKVASFLDTISQMPEQMQKLSEIKNVKELTENAQNIKLLIESADGLASVTGTVIEVADAARGVKITKEDNSVFKAIKGNGLWTLGTVASGGWTLLADASNSLTGDNVGESILYETEIGELSMFMSIHADIAQKMAEKQNPTADELKEYFFSVKSYLKMKKLELSLKYRDDVAVWKMENKGLFTKVLYFIAGASDTENILAGKKAEYGSMNANYEKMEKNVDALMQQYGVELK